MSAEDATAPDEEYTYLMDAADLPAGERAVVTVGNRELALFNLDGEYHCLSNYCVHQGGPICDGLVSGAVLEEDGELVWSEERTYVSCPWHGWEFDIETGKHMTNEKYRLPSYDVFEIDGSLYGDL